MTPIKGQRFFLLGLFVALAVVGVWNPSSSRAGTFNVATCASANGANRSWALVNELPASYESSDVTDGFPRCDPFRGLWAQSRLMAAVTPQAGTEVRFAISAEAGTAFTAIAYDRYFFKLADPSWDPGFVRTAASPDGTVLDGQCVYEPVDDDACELTGSVALTFQPASRLEFGLRCSAGSVFGFPTTTCGGGATLHHAVAELHSASVTVSDSGAPVVGELTGGGLSAGWITGSSLDVSTTASDASGIQSARVLVDGAPVGPVISGSCTTVAGAPGTYTTPKPCADRDAGHPVAGTVDLTSVADGTHTVAIQVTDPAGNSATTTAAPFNVDRTPPAAPIAANVTPGLPGENGWARSAPSALAWTSAPGQVAPIAASHVRVCREGAACVTASTTGTSLTGTPLAALFAQGDGTYTVQISQGDTAGNGATFDVGRAITRTVDVDSHPPDAPLSLSLSSADPASWIRAGTTGLTWVPAANSGSALGPAWVEVCQRGGACRQQRFDAFGQLSVSDLAGLASEDGAYDVAVSLADEAGNGAAAFDAARAATTTLLIDGTPPASPTGLHGTGTQTTPSFAIGWTLPGGQVSPLAAIHLSLCPRAGGPCSTPTLAGDATATTLVVPPGTHRLRVWAEDAAGNADPDGAAEGELAYVPSPGGGEDPGPTPPPGGSSPPGGDTADPPAIRRAPTLTLTTARYATSRRQLTVTGRGPASTKLAGTVAVATTDRRTGKRARIARSVTLRTDRAGRFTLRPAPLGRASGRAVATSRTPTVTLTTRATDTWRSARATRRVARR